MRETRSNAISCQDSVRSATYAASINHDCRYVKATEQKQALPFRIDPFQSCALNNRRKEEDEETLRKWLLCCLPLSLSLFRLLILSFHHLLVRRKQRRKGSISTILSAKSVPCAHSYIRLLRLGNGVSKRRDETETTDDEVKSQTLASGESSQPIGTRTKKKKKRGGSGYQDRASTITTWKEPFCCCGIKVQLTDI